MNRALLLRRLLLAPPNLRASLIPQSVAFQTSRSYGVQSITQASFWKNLVPKPFRQSERSTVSKKPKSKDWNPATFFIWIFLLIGSMSIQMIALRNEYSTFDRRADAKISLLKEIIGKIQNGEKVDVEGLLGTGNEEKEREWEEVLQEIEREEEAMARARSKKARQNRKPKGEDKSTSDAVSENQEFSQQKSQNNAPRGFY